MNDLIDYQFDNETVRVILIGDEPWWVAGDVAKVLGYSRAPDLVRHLDDDEKGVHILHTLGGQQEMTVISESGLFAAILKSRKAEARRFRRWVTGEVLPSIRKTGRYILHDEPPELPSPAIDDADLPKLTAAVAVMREARQVWGRKEAQAIWVKLGLPSPIAEATAEEDALAAQVQRIVKGRDRVRTIELAEAMGLTLDTKLSLRLTAVLRLMGFTSRKRRISGVQVHVWERVGVPAEAGEA